MFRKYDLKAAIVENVSLVGKYFRIRVHAPEIARQAGPGHFCMIRPEHSGERLLRRPFSIAAVRDGELLEFAYTTIGIGTRLLGQCKPGDKLLCLGPLGNTFPIIEGTKIIVVAGGIGIAPFPFLNRVLNERKIFPVVYYGARSADELIYLEELNQLSEKVIIATDDGSAGFHGVVTKVLDADLAQNQKGMIFGCGPHPMLRALKQVAERHGLTAYLSMEETMGCGIGICIGCPIPGVTPEGEATNYLCCKDGPIFDSRMVTL